VKKLVASLLSLGLLLASCAAPTLTASPLESTTTAAPATTSDPMHSAWNDRSIFQDGLVESEWHVLNELAGASVYHLEFNIEDDMRHITGAEQVQYTNTETVPLSEVEFRLFPNILGGAMQVTNVRANDQTVTPSYGLENSLMILPLPKPLEPGHNTILKMDFEVTVPTELDPYYGMLVWYGNVLSLAHAYPKICVYDDEGWNAEIPSTEGDVTYSDAAFYLVRVTAPKGLTLITSGREISSGSADQVQTLVAASGPARDFIVAASPDYAEVSKAFGEVAIHSYAAKGSEAGADFAMQVASGAIDVYSRHYAPYPYTDLNIVATPTLALGIEYPGLIVIADRIYDISGTYRDSPTSAYMESTVAHEVAHQWFYNLVGNDQLDDPWLDESLAQFATLQYYSDEHGAAGANAWQASLEERWARTENANIPIGLPVSKYNPGEYGSIVYGRGALFFEALKNTMGATKFDAFLQDYTATLSWNIATPQIFQSLAEKHCGCNLSALFQEWVYR